MRAGVRVRARRGLRTRLANRRDCGHFLAAQVVCQLSAGSEMSLVNVLIYLYLHWHAVIYRVQ